MAARCPKCREGALFTGYLTVNESCAVCGLDLRAHDSGDGPAVFVIFIVGALAVIGALTLEVLASPPYWVHVVVQPIAITAVTLGLLRPLKAKFIEIQYRRRSTAL